MTIFVACGNGDLDKVKKFIDSGVYVDESDGTYNNTPLFYAVYNNHIGVVKYLLDNGANINHFCTSNNTALIWAFNGRYKKMIRYLILRGAKIKSYILQIDNIKHELHNNYELQKLLISKNSSNLSLFYSNKIHIHKWIKRRIS